MVQLFPSPPAKKLGAGAFFLTMWHYAEKAGILVIEHLNIFLPTLIWLVLHSSRMQKPLKFLLNFSQIKFIWVLLLNQCVHDGEEGPGLLIPSSCWCHSPKNTNLKLNDRDLHPYIWHELRKVRSLFWVLFISSLELKLIIMLPTS